MTMERHLFLFGSSPPFNEQLANIFYSRLTSCKVAVLYIEREGSDEYIPKYVESFSEEIKLWPLALKDEYTIEEIAELRQCGGVIIGGGDTLRYRQFVVETEIARVIHSLFHQGVPVAGFSAGALISMNPCVVSPRDNVEEKQLFEKGLGLLPDAVLSAHFLEWEEHQALRRAVEKTGVTIGYGIAEQSGAYFRNDRLTSVEGYVHLEYNNNV